MEYYLLIYFTSNENKVISKSAIAEHLWGDDMDLADNYDLLYTHIKICAKNYSRQAAPIILNLFTGLAINLPSDKT